MVATLFLVTLAAPASGQLSWGLHATKAVETRGGTWGGGANLKVGFPVFPLDAVGAIDYFRPDCPQSDDCTFWGWSLDARFRLPFPIVHPYVTGGWVQRRFDVSNEDDSVTERGVAFGVGLEVDLLGAMQVFLEGRYELVDTPSNQVVWRVGLYF